MSLPKYGVKISEFVRRYRRDYEITQAELGKQLGVHPQYVSNVERGVNEFPVAFCALLIPFLDDDRRKYLNDLMMEASLDRLSVKLGVEDELQKRIKYRHKTKFKAIK